MKRLFVLVLLILCIVSMAGCFQQTKLTIINTSGYHLELVCWNGYYFTNDEVWDAVDEAYYPCLRKGTSVTRRVDPDYAYVTFWHVNGGKYETRFPVRVNSWQHKIFYLDDYQVGEAIQILSVTASQKIEAKESFSK